jgi:hypothetical protein
VLGLVELRSSVVALLKSEYVEVPVFGSDTDAKRLRAS